MATRTLHISEGARCEICGSQNRFLLGEYRFGWGLRRERAILCLHHAAPLEAGVLGRSERPHRPSKSELFEFWEARRPGILWLSPERRLLRDRRDRQRAGELAGPPDRRRILR